METMLAPTSPTAGRDLGALIQASWKLWLMSLRSCLLDAFMLSLLPQLPLLLWWWQTRPRFAEQPWFTWLEPDLWSFGVSALVSNVVVNLIALGFLLAVLHRQGMILRGGSSGTSSRARALTCLPAASVASLIYAVLLAASLLPTGLAWFVGQQGADPLFLLFALLIGLIISAVPLAWVSIAACWIYPPILLENESAVAATRISLRLVRGNWARCAVLLSLFTLIVLGILGVVGAAPFAITASIVMANEGISALARPGWLVFGQLLSTPLTAACVPLMTAAYMVLYEELRAPRTRSLSATGTARLG